MKRSELDKLSDNQYLSYIESKGHILKREDGEIDIWVLDADYHNGPGCVKCHDCWCYHCRDEIDECEG